MTTRPDTSQLSLDFQAEEGSASQTTPRVCNVIPFAARFLPSRQGPAAPPEEVDSVLQELLTDAKRLSW